jgi:hypothetical protein
LCRNIGREITITAVVRTGCLLLSALRTQVRYRARSEKCQELTWSDRMSPKKQPPEGGCQNGRMLFDEISSLTGHNRNTQERRRNGGGVVIRAFVLTVEQTLQFRPQITGSIALFRSFERIHGWSIIFSECINEF